MDFSDLRMHFCHSSVVFEKIPNDDQTLASVVFALNAGFAAIDSFTQGIMRSLRKSLLQQLEKYKGPRWEDPIGKENTGSNLKLREEVNNLAEEIVTIQKLLPVTFGQKAKFWKWIMGLCAVVCLVLMAIPYCGRFILFLALPVPLFALSCNLKVKSKLALIDQRYDLILTEIKTNEGTIGCATLEKLQNFAREVSTIVANIKSESARDKGKKQGRKRR